MIFSDIVAAIQADLNLTSTSSATRIGDRVNRVYKKICTDPMISIDTVGEVLGVSATTVIGNQQLTWGTATTTPSTAVEKILRVFDPSVTPPRALTPASVDEIQLGVLSTDPAQRWAPLAQGASSVTVLLDSVPTSNYALLADVLSNQAILSGSMVPAFAEDFHDLLIIGGKYWELKKMQNYAGAAEEDRQFEKRMGELRLFLALSGHQKTYSGKTNDFSGFVSTRI